MTIFIPQLGPRLWSTPTVHVQVPRVARFCVRFIIKTFNLAYFRILYSKISAGCKVANLLIIHSCQVASQCSSYSSVILHCIKIFSTFSRGQEQARSVWLYSIIIFLGSGRCANDALKTEDPIWASTDIWKRWNTFKWIQQQKIYC